MGEGATLEELMSQVADFVTKREWEVFHNPKDLAIAMAVEASELLEHFLWRTPEEINQLLPELKEKIEEELADVFIYGLSMANALSVDLADAIHRKLRKNEKRFPVDRFRGRAYG
ncbi:MAG: nucleotide pyrophosphohydrolase [Candidatus Thermoplasmatota archaeon]|nr:nucleotide pyrophosphohydrolase [Candidatus Thermoplasmatota archaeon]